MKSNPLPTQEFLKECLIYDPDTGFLYWKERPLSHFKDSRSQKIWNTKNAGNQAFNNDDSKGYKCGGLLGIKWRAHRIVYKLVYGVDPEYIDHAMGVRTDNRLDKIESVTETYNNRNQKMPSTNKSGVMGVYWNKDMKKWHASIKKNNKKIHLGYFSDLDEAARVRKAAEVELGYHPNHGRAVTNSYT